MQRRICQEIMTAVMMQTTTHQVLSQDNDETPQGWGTERQLDRDMQAITYLTEGSSSGTLPTRRGAPNMPFSQWTCTGLAASCQVILQWTSRDSV